MKEGKNQVAQKPIAGIKKESYPAAIEISSTALKLLQLARIQRQRYEIVRAAYLPYKISSQFRFSAIKDYLKKLIEENRIKGEVVSSLAINKIQTFIYLLPDMPESEIPSAIAWKIKQNLPEDVLFDNISFDYLSYMNYRQGSGNKEIQVLVFAAFKDMVLEQTKLFKDLSLELIAVEPEPYAALRSLFWLGKIAEGETILVIHLGAEHSSITIVRSGQPCLMRPLNVSGKTCTEAVANYLQLDWEKAEQLKQEEGLTPGSKSLLALTSQMENLIVDIEHTFKYFSHQLTKSEVGAYDRILLYGGGAGLNNLSTFFSERLVVPVDIFNPLVQFDLFGHENVGPLVKENFVSFASTLGLALKYIE